MSAVIFALISFVGWGVGDLLVAITSRRLSPFSATFWSMLLTLILFGAYIPFALVDLSNMTFPLLLLNLFLGILLIGGIVAYREGLRIGNPALVGTIANSFGLVTTVLAVIFFKESLTNYQLLTILLIFIGLFLSTFNIKKAFESKVGFNKGILLAFVAMISWGVYLTFIKIPVQELGWFWPNYISYTLLPIIFIIIKIRHIPLLAPNTNNAFMPLIVSTIFVRIAEFSFNVGISYGFTSIVAPISGASPALFVLLAFLFFKDPVTKQQIAGIVITLIGIILLSIFSS